jgi:hypothetical protein
MTRFRLDETRVSGQRPLLKCSRCQHIFPLPGSSPRDPDATPVHFSRPAEPKPARRRAPRRQEEPANLSFSFGDEDDDWEAGSPGDESVAEEKFSLTAAEARETEVLLDSVGPDAQPPDEEDAVVPSEASSAGGGITLRPVFVFLFIVVSAYMVLAGTLYANPDFTDQIVRNVPLVGTGVGGLINRKVLLIDVEGSYERTRAGKDIFVVTGAAVNHAEFSLSSIQVRIQLLDSGGNVLHERVVFCGSTVPRKLLRDLTVAEVSVLGRLKPPRTLLIRPGERAPFMAVFADPSPAVSELSTQVAAAQRQL